MEISSSSHSYNEFLDTLELTSEIFEENLALNKDGKVGFSLKKRAHSKSLNTMLYGTMLYGNFALHENYQKTYYCSHQIMTNGEIAKSSFCRKRWCMICNRIRTAQLISAYMPTLESWENKSFLTLTIPNMKKTELVPSLKEMYQAFTKIKDQQRKRKVKLVGLRKLECTYNRTTDKFHPHYHMIMEDGKHDEEIISEWLKRFPEASRSGQDTKPANANSCFELFKYFTKLSSNSSKDNKITIHALDTIFNSITGVRTFQPFGFVAHKPEKPPDSLDLNEKPELNSEYTYSKEVGDWANIETGELLTNYTKNNEYSRQFAKAIRTT